MRQTNNAIKMLASAYRAVITNCYILKNKSLVGGG